MRKPVLLGGAIALGLAGLAATLLFENGRGPAVVRPRAGAGAPDNLDARLHAADVATGARLFATCAACHSVGRGGPDVDGPNLYGVVGSRIAERRPRYGYSAALRRAGGTWSFARLDAWLTAPAAFAPGTTMGFPGLPDAQDRADVIAFLATQGSTVPLP